MSRDAAALGDARIARPRILLIIAAILAAFTLYAALHTYGYREHYRSLFDSFGAALYGIVAYALYLPIMSMGKAI